MKHLIIVFFIINSGSSFSQDFTSSGMGSKNFDHLYKAIKQECGYENGYAGVKLKKTKIKKDLWIVSIVNEIMLAKLSIQDADSILKKRGIKPFVRPYNKTGYEVIHMIINGNYIEFSIISATEKKTPITYVGATLKSNYEIHCKPNPLFVIPSVNIDVDFFRKRVMKKISCHYNVFNDLELGVANYMANKLNLIF